MLRSKSFVSVLIQNMIPYKQSRFYDDWLSLMRVQKVNDISSMDLYYTRVLYATYKMQKDRLFSDLPDSIDRCHPAACKSTTRNQYIDRRISRTHHKSIENQIEKVQQHVVRKRRLTSPSEFVFLSHLAKVLRLIPKKLFFSSKQNIKETQELFKK